MPPSSDDIARLRRMTNEPTTTTYSDALLTAYLEAWPIVDSEGRSSDEDNWTEGYDLHAAAADVWEEKAATFSPKHDFSADGANYSSNQLFENALEQARYHRSKQQAKVKLVVKRPDEALSNGGFALGFRNQVDESESGYEIWNEL